MMRSLRMQPGLNAGEAGHGADWPSRESRRQVGIRGPIVLAAGVLLGIIYVTPAAYSPLTLLGVLVTPAQVDDSPIVMIAATIAVHPSDLPAQRPSLAAARSVDDIEAAHFVGTVPPLPTVAAATRADEPTEDAAIPTTTATALPAPKTPSIAQQPYPKKQPATSGSDEDFNDVKRRAFNSER